MLGSTSSSVSKKTNDLHKKNIEKTYEVDDSNEKKYVNNLEKLYLIRIETS